MLCIHEKSHLSAFVGLEDKNLFIKAYPVPYVLADRQHVDRENRIDIPTVVDPEFVLVVEGKTSDRYRGNRRGRQCHPRRRRVCR